MYMGAVEALECLRILARTDERVRVAWGLSGGKYDKSDPYAAADAMSIVRTVEWWAAETDQSSRFTVYRIER